MRAGVRDVEQPVAVVDHRDELARDLRRTKHSGEEIATAVHDGIRDLDAEERQLLKTSGARIAACHRGDPGPRAAEADVPRLGLHPEPGPPLHAGGS